MICEYKIHDIGQTIITNVCDDTTKVIPWGQMDYMFFGFISIMVFALFYCVYKIATT